MDAKMCIKKTKQIVPLTYTKTHIFFIFLRA